MDSKAKQVRTDVKRSKKPSPEYTEGMKQYHVYCRKGTHPDGDCAIAFDMYHDSLQKEIIESLLFGDAKPEDIEEVFGDNVVTTHPVSKVL